MLKSTRNLIVSPPGSKADVKSKPSPSASSPQQEPKRVIGPQLPTPSPSVAKISPSPRTIPLKPNLSPLVKPKTISESPSVKAKSPPVKLGLVPYDGDSDSDEADQKQAPLPAVHNKAKDVLPSNEQKPSVPTSSPFLPRAVNLKKLKDTVQKEDSLHLSLTNGSKVIPKIPSPAGSKKTEPNRDPSSEILYAKEVLDKETSSKTDNKANGVRRNEFHIRDIDSHSPSVHSDNSSGSTASFTVSDITAGARNGNSSENFLNTSRQKWNVIPQSSNQDQGSVMNGKPEQSAKRERSEPVKSDKDECETLSEAGLQGSPKKRKKTALFEAGGNIFEKAAEIGKEFLNVGAKLFKTAKNGKDDDDSNVVESGTNCEATTSQSHEKASSSKISNEKEDFDIKPKKNKKKKKKKHRDEKDASDTDAWVEKTKDNLNEFKEIIRKDEEARKDIDINIKKSSFNAEAPVKNWDSKPDLKTIGRSVTWDGSKGANITEQLRKNTEIRSWSGERSKDLERKSLESRKRSAAQDLDAELDAGRVKKVKKFREDSSKWNEKNPFQLAQDHRNKGDNFTDKPEFQRR